jgi:hypothetical protein
MPTVAPGSVDKVNVNGAGETTTVTTDVVVLTGVLVSVALTVMGYVPAVVGVPVTTQFAPRVRPAGSGPVTSTQA